MLLLNLCGQVASQKTVRWVHFVSIGAGTEFLQLEERTFSYIPYPCIFYTSTTPTVPSSLNHFMRYLKSKKTYPQLCPRLPDPLAAVSKNGFPTHGIPCHWFYQCTGVAYSCTTRRNRAHGRFISELTTTGLVTSFSPKSVALMFFKNCCCFIFWFWVGTTTHRVVPAHSCVHESKEIRA